MTKSRKSSLVSEGWRLAESRLAGGNAGLSWVRRRATSRYRPHWGGGSGSLPNGRHRDGRQIDNAGDFGADVGGMWIVGQLQGQVDQPGEWIGLAAPPSGP